MKKIKYEELNAKAKEMYNFQKVSAVLADYGYMTMWLNNDWNGADFIAIHVGGEKDLKIQLKARISFDKKYLGKDIHICFRDGDDYYLYPHDTILNEVEKKISDKKWIKTGTWSTSRSTKYFKELLKEYKL